MIFRNGLIFWTFCYSLLEFCTVQCRLRNHKIIDVKELLDHNEEDLSTYRNQQDSLGLKSKKDFYKNLRYNKNLNPDKDSKKPILALVRNSKPHENVEGIVEISGKLQSNNKGTEVPDSKMHLSKELLIQRSSCNKAAAKACSKACKGVLKKVCHDYKCSSGMKSRFKSECKSNCKSKFK